MAGRDRDRIICRADARIRVRHFYSPTIANSAQQRLSGSNRQLGSGQGRGLRMSAFGSSADINGISAHVRAFGGYRLYLRKPAAQRKYEFKTGAAGVCF
jgi:hypothetical protein